MKREIWVSDNGKYKVIARKFDDNTIDIGYWRLEGDKDKDVRYRDLPNYVKDKINAMKHGLEETMSKQKNALISPSKP